MTQIPANDRRERPSATSLIAMSDAYHRPTPRKITTGTYSHPWRLTSATRSIAKKAIQTVVTSALEGKKFATGTCAG